MIEFNFPLLSTEEQQSIFGAYGESYSLQGGDTIIGNPDNPWGWDDPFYGDNGGDGNWGPDYGDGGGGSMPDDFYDDLNGYWDVDENGTPIFSITLDGVEVKAKADTSAEEAISLMLSSMGTAFDAASVSAVIAGIEEIKFIKIGGNAFGVLGTLLGTPDYLDKIETGSAGWDDHVKYWAPVALMIPGINGGIVLAGGVVIAGWEIYDMVNKK